MKYSKFFKISLIAIIITLCLIALTVFILDPCFHYRTPYNWISYALFDEGYQNYGIASNFKYNLIITGNSLTECFKTSEADRIFNTKSVRVSAAGSSLSEQRDYLETAFANNNEIEYVIWGLDYGRINENPGIKRDDSPAWYLYDDSVINDIRYLLNKDMLISSMKTLFKTVAGLPPDSFDTFENWLDHKEFGRESLGLPSFLSYDSREVENVFPNNNASVPENISSCVLPVVSEHPETTFYFFLTPYFFSYFDNLRNSGSLSERLAQEWATITALLQYENVRVFSFHDDGTIITNPANYHDTSHYGSWINSYILECMGNGKQQVTKENFDDYCRRTYVFLTNYNYKALIENASD